MRLTCIIPTLLLLCACTPGANPGEADDGAADDGATEDGPANGGPADDGPQTDPLGTTSDGGPSTTEGDSGEWGTTYGEDWNTDDSSDPTTSGEEIDCELGEGPDLVVSVDYDSPKAKKNDYFAFNDLPCIVGSPASQLTCETAPGIIEDFGVVAGVAGAGLDYPWAEGDSVRLSTNYIGEEMGIQAYDTSVAVRTPEGLLLLAAAGDGITASAAPLAVSTEIACDVDDDTILLRVTYEMEGQVAEIIGHGAVTLETPSGTYEILQEADYTILGTDDSNDLTAVVMRTGD